MSDPISQAEIESVYLRHELSQLIADARVTVTERDRLRGELERLRKGLGEWERENRDASATVDTSPLRALLDNPTPDPPKVL